MCAGAIQLARLARVVLAAWEPRTGACGSVRDVLRDPRANHRVEVVAGVRAEESQIEEVQRKNGMARPSHPAPSTPNPPVQPPPKKAELRPNKRPDLPKPPPQPRPEQRRIAT